VYLLSFIKLQGSFLVKNIWDSKDEKIIHQKETAQMNQRIQRKNEKQSEINFLYLQLLFYTRIYASVNI